ncbi:hypothetical protein EJ06DRAFT_472620, partial [Trichodelitschia bisporula]
MQQSVQALSDNAGLSTLPYAAGAAYPSGEDEHEPLCLLNTREDVLNHISNWAAIGKRILWLHGPAGMGKSTIARTAARRFLKQGRLGATFFFKRGAGDRSNASRFFTTIAFQLSAKLPTVKRLLAKAIKDDPSIIGKPKAEQFERLILEPLSAMNSLSLQALPLIIVIDALDECDNQDDVKRLLQLLEQCTSTDATRLQILITSRPELPVDLGFRAMSKELHHDVSLYEIQENTIRADIATFYKHQLPKIAEEHKKAYGIELPPNWPGAESLEDLLNMSTPLFIFAATVCLFLADTDADLEAGLAAILKEKHQISRLAQTYLPILRWPLSRPRTNLSDHEKRLRIKQFREAVGPIILLASPLSTSALAKLLGIREHDVVRRLNPLRSVLNIPRNNDDPVTLLHLSFREFLLDEALAEEFLVDEQETHMDLARMCLEHMRKSGHLRKDICKVQAPGTLREDIDAQTINNALPADVQYSCRYWVHHLSLCPDLSLYRGQVLSFLKGYFLYWLEAMSLMGRMLETVSALDSLWLLFSNDEVDELENFLLDAKRFLLQNVWMIGQAPLQTYISALIFAPERSIVREQFRMEIPCWIRLPPKMQDSWDALLQTLEGHENWVNAVAFSPDGKQLASASYD